MFYRPSKGILKTLHDELSKNLGDHNHNNHSHTVERNRFATFEKHMLKKSSQTKDKPRSHVTPGKHIFHQP